MDQSGSNEQGVRQSFRKSQCSSSQNRVPFGNVLFLADRSLKTYINPESLWSLPRQQKYCACRNTKNCAIKYLHPVVDSGDSDSDDGEKDVADEDDNQKRTSTTTSFVEDVLLQSSI